MNQPLYIYGAGNLAQYLLPKLKTAGYTISGIVDDKKVGSSFEEYTVISLGDLDQGSILMICVLNNWVDISKIRQTAMANGCQKVLTPPEIFFLLGDVGHEINWYWLESRRSLVESIHDNSLELLKDRLIDDISRITLSSIFNYRLKGLIPSEYIFEESEQYLETGFLDFWSGEIRLIDCGSYTGDTLKQIQDRGLNLVEALAIEPDPINYSMLLNQVENLRIEAICLNSAIGSENLLVSFESNGDSGSHISSPASTSSLVNQIKFDSTFPTGSYSHVKMDIEGSELSALRGMSRLLKNKAPKLAISVYHKPDDLVSIPEFLINDCGYTHFSLRTFANQTFETILYAKKA